MFDTRILSLRLRKMPFYEVSPQPDAAGNIRYVIRLGQNYIRLSEPYYRLFDGMDGKTSLHRLSDRVFDGVPPDPGSLVEFLAMLHRNSLIMPISTGFENLFNRVDGHDNATRLSILARIGQRIIKSKISFSRADRLTTLAYRYLGRYFLSRVGLILIALISLLGTSYFISEIPDLVSSWSFEDIFLFGDSYVLGLVGAFAVGGVTVFIHEAAHALTCKHFDRRVSGFGLMLYYGAPACFTDTTDCWTLPKRQRLAVDAAGIITNLFLGSLSFLMLPVVTSFVAYQLCIMCTLANFIAAAMNLIPFLKLDGYFILSDMLDLPNLRENAIELVLNARSLIGALRARNGYFRTILVLLFGVGSIAYGGVVIAYGTYAIFMFVRVLAPTPKGTYLAFLLACVPVCAVVSYAISQVKKIRAKKPAGIASPLQFKESGQH